MVTAVGEAHLRRAAHGPERLFTPLGTNQMSIRFFVPGSTKPATVKDFGAVFADVDKPDSTKIELYDRWGTRLWWRYVSKGTTANLEPAVPRRQVDRRRLRGANHHRQRAAGSPHHRRRHA